MRLVLDSSVITEHDWHLHGPAASALIEAAERSRIVLVVPELVVREVANSYREREQQKIDKVNRARDELRRMQMPYSADIPGDEDFPPRYERHEQGIREKLERVDAIRPIPNVPQEEVVTRALARRRPFDKQGQGGYRDALIWHTVLDVIHRADVTVLATTDGDFADAKDATRLHSDLRDDLVARGFTKDNVRLCGSLEEAVRLTLQPAQAVVDALTKRLQGDDAYRAELEEQLRELALTEASSAEEPVVAFELEEAAQPFSDDVTEWELDELDNFGSAEVFDAHGFSERRFLVWIRVPAVATYQVEISTSGFWRDPARAPDGLTLSLDEKHAYVYAFADVALEFAGIYDADEDKLGEFELAFIRPAA